MTRTKIQKSYPQTRQRTRNRKDAALNASSTSRVATSKQRRETSTETGSKSRSGVFLKHVLIPTKNEYTPNSQTLDQKQPNDSNTTNDCGIDTDCGSSTQASNIDTGSSPSAQPSTSKRQDKVQLEMPTIPREEVVKLLAISDPVKRNRARYEKTYTDKTCQAYGGALASLRGVKRALAWCDPTWFKTIGVEVPKSLADVDRTVAELEEKICKEYGVRYAGSMDKNVDWVWNPAGRGLRW
ncbi:hypothetical protein BJ508DRAFT_415743 [Ascobolus immersus RN42]|uniref:Uncharacterized protein n=1 Tax=Ascobolus immersus RN42 TaxID=1160509 RepID=A0A3N4I6E7_ASCIM|nr:hypothetical protein BJ508DRAFT_415743 [Ascobolus immersus RN42]